ncbi:hypothetical protein [Candidatus Villigracilis saccharophilus]|nr:hypothetical protein [Anaerolineales bacterium]
MKLLFLFFDGIGLGENNPEKSVHARQDAVFKFSLGGRTLFRIRAF